MSFGSASIARVRSRSTRSTSDDARRASTADENPAAGSSTTRMRKGATAAVSFAPTESSSADCAASSPEVKVTMKVRTSPGAGGSEGGAVGSAVGSGVGSGAAGSEGSGAGRWVGSGVASSAGEASGLGGGVGSVANAASGDMIVEMNTTSMKNTRTLRVVDWRAIAGTKLIPRSTVIRQARAGDRQRYVCGPDPPSGAVRAETRIGRYVYRPRAQYRALHKPRCRAAAGVIDSAGDRS